MRVFAATALLLGLADALVMPTARAAARGVAKRAGFDEENSSPAAGAGSTFGGDSPGSTFGGENMPEELKKIMANVEEGFKSSDSTGSLYFVGQLSLIACVVLGGVPIVGSALELVMGPGCVLTGLAMLGLGVTELGPENLTPFPSPTANNQLKTNGVFALSRHPMYSGLLLSSFGLGVTTHSFQRILAVILLYVLFDAKTANEEAALSVRWPAYDAYAATVPKFLPGFLTLKSAIDSK